MALGGPPPDAVVLRSCALVALAFDADLLRVSYYLMNIGPLPRWCRLQVIRISTTLRFVLKAPYLGGLIGARPYLGSSACQAQGSQKLWTMRI